MTTALTIKTEQSSMTPQRLVGQNRRFAGTGGVSENNRCRGFLPAFLDTHTGSVYLSRFRDGRMAPIHLLDGLPPELVLERTPSGRVASVRHSVTAGFVLEGRFYTREQAAAATTH